MAFWLFASAMLSITAASAQPPWANGNFGGFPACVDDCHSGVGPGSFLEQCKNATAVAALNSCVAGSSCSDADKNTAYQAVAQLCAFAGTTLTVAPEATVSVTSGIFPWASGFQSHTAAWGSAYSSWTSAHGTPPNGAWGPFGGPGNGWGDGPWGSDAPWTSGPWTSWWGTDACPVSTWPGWTEGPWATNAPWTSWTACAATTTATSVVTSVVTASGTQSVQIQTSYGVQVNQATSTDSSTPTGAAKAADVKLAGSAAGVVGLMAGALFL